MKVLTVFIISVVMVFSVNPNVAFSQETIKIAVGNWPPYFSEKLKHKGVVARMIREIFSAEGYNVTFRFFPWARAYEEAKKGRFDATGIWLKKPGRETDFHYSDPVLNEKHLFFHLKEFQFDWKNIDDLKDLRIGGIIRFSYGEEFDKAEKSGNLRVDRVSTDLQNFKKLLAGRLHIYPQEINVGFHALRSNLKPEEIQRITYHPKILMEKESYLLFSKKIKSNKALIVKFNNGLNRLKNSGNYQRYFEPAVPRKQSQ